MDNYFVDERTGLKYEFASDYYVIAGGDTPEEGLSSIGLWGQRHLRYLKEHRELIFDGLLFSGKLWRYLAEINQQAEDRLALLTEQMKQSEGVTEQLKAAAQMKWVQQMYCIQNRAEEIVNSELIYAK